ncbi:MAG: carboxypeptidase-like regulatory domain-containing protein [Muribaculaceae bacterium]|nr:carboxypeptidase-like regulatory domain-containing protein [Muribaculaceae bacterium]
MARGKQTCKILKEIRRQIAEANGIEFTTSECRFKGDCLGTCPKCEAEVRYLEQKLSSRQRMGKSVALAGISAASLAMLLPMTSEAQTAQEPQNLLQESMRVMADSITVRGIVLDGETQVPLIGATILNKRTASGVCSDSEGHFELPACIGDTLEMKFITFTTQEIIVTEALRDTTMTVLLNPGGMALEGIMPIGKYMSHVDLRKNQYFDFNIIDEKGNLIDPEDFTIFIERVDEDGEEYSDYLHNEFIDEKHPCRIYWDVINEFQNEDSKPAKEAKIVIVAEGYDDPVTIKVKSLKRNAKKTIKFKHKKK